MACNVGAADRVIRAVIGTIVLVLGIIFKSWWGALGLTLLLTSAFRWCPLYFPLKLSTREEGASSSSDGESR